MESLYPLKFQPILKEKLWGGNNLVRYLNKEASEDEKIGESWEISGLTPEISVVSNGFLKGNTLQEMIEVYMGDLLGDKVYEKFGIEFPLLIKFIDATEVLSIQVHPDDHTAIARHNAYGKTEMWYILKAQKNAWLINGFKKDTEKDIYLQALHSGKLEEILNIETVQEDDVFFIPAGRVHAIGSGIVLAEIQQTSDITYRIYDWGRLDDKGNSRELHTSLAVDVIDFKGINSSKINYTEQSNYTSDIIECPYFKTNLISIDQALEKDYIGIDSFVIYICIEGSVRISFGKNREESLKAGECIMIPAVLKNLVLNPEGKLKLLEVYLPE